MFEDFIDIEEQSFYVKKLEDNKYLSFAYNDNKIIEAIKESNLTLSQVKNIYFAQIEFLSFYDEVNTHLKVDNINLSFIDNILVQIPSRLKINDNISSLNIQNINLSKDNIYINASSKYLDSKSAYKLSIIFLLLSIFTFGKYFSNQEIIDKIPTQIENLKENSKMLSTSLQTNAVIKKLEKISLKQKGIREIFKYILLYKDNSKSVITSMEYLNNTINLEYDNVSAPKLKVYLEKRYQLKKIVKKGSKVIVGIKI
ncbi:MAG: hypothetical protein U9Q30_03025 [Campylobacterota bacterium]|nr:hypothetical protein [Campylobacterota bacterium]